MAVRNHGRSQDFGQFDQSDAARRLSAVGRVTVDLPQLDASTMYRIDASGASFWAAANASEGSYALGPLQRQRARLWLQRSYTPLDAMSDGL